MVGKTLGHYRILEKIGAGGMGEVYRARDEHLNRDVAIKVLPTGTLADEAARKRFRKEAEALSKLNHPNIATVFDFDSQDGLDFLAMEYIPGSSLSEKLAAGPLSEKESARLGEQLAEGLAAAHTQGVLHRDLKPANLRLTPDARLKILDFGLAKLLQPVSEVTVESLTETRAVAGTLPYMSPEQLRAEALDARSDLYSVGVVLYEMATGRRPFEAKIATTLTGAILHQPPASPRALRPAVSAELERIILKCLEKDPDNRYQSAKELAVDLRRLGAPTAPLAAQPTPARVPARWVWRLAAPTAAVAVILVVLFTLNVGGLRERLLGRVGPPRIESIAVLPLANLSRDPEQDYFADGMTEALIADLAKIGALRVISRTSVMRYKGTQKPLPEIARELKVDAVVEGSVLRAGERVRITAQLVRAVPEEHLWAERYERDLRDVLALQSEVARAIAQQIKVKLTPQEQARLATARQVNPAAHEAYLKGRYHYNRITPFGKSIEYFQQATALDPTYAAPHAGLADVYTILAYAGRGPAREHFAKAKAAARRAVELDDTLAEAHAAMGWALLHDDWDWAGAKREMRRALELNPNSVTAHFHYSTFLSFVGRHTEAIATAQRGLELDPLSFLATMNVAWRYQSARQYEKAIEYFRKALELDPNSDFAKEEIAEVLLQMGKYEEAIRELHKLREAPGLEGFVSVMLVEAYARTGRKREAAREFERVKVFDQKRLIPPAIMANAYLLRGDRERAIPRLEQAYEERDPWLLYVLKMDSDLFKPLDPNPRFQDLLRRMNFPK